jgi:hypothetical protein
MRLFLLLFAVVCAVFGILFGALNPQPVRVDLYWLGIETTQGVSLLVATLAGAVCGGLAVIVGVVWPMKTRLRRAIRNEARSASRVSESPDPNLLAYHPDRP